MPPRSTGAFAKWWSSHFLRSHLVGTASFTGLFALKGQPHVSPGQSATAKPYSAALGRDWIVERTLGWLGRFRLMGREHEATLPQQPRRSHENEHRLAHIA